MECVAGDATKVCVGLVVERMRERISFTGFKISIPAEQSSALNLIPEGNTILWLV